MGDGGINLGAHGRSGGVPRRGIGERLESEKCRSDNAEAFGNLRLKTPKHGSTLPRNPPAWQSQKQFCHGGTETRILDGFEYWRVSETVNTYVKKMAAFSL
jgi:hypothetical protein